MGTATNTDSTNDPMSADLPLRVGFRTTTLSDERLAYIRQLGVRDVFINPTQPQRGTGGDIYEDASDRTGSDRPLVLTPEHVPTTAALVQLRRAAEDAGIRLAGVQSLGFNMYGDVMFGRDGSDTQLAAIKRLIRNMGAADLPILGYQWNPRGLVPMRTSRTVRIRGNARATAFDDSDLQHPIEPTQTVKHDDTETAFWDNYEQFLETVLPVAEKAGVRLALHPADPPVVRELGGIPRLFSDVDRLERAMQIVPSDHHGLKLCLGCVSEMGEDVVAVIRRFADQDSIVFVHFRDVIGTYPSFTETFVDDAAGNFDAYEALQTLDDVGFSGIVIPDHVPSMEGDTDWGHRSRGYTAGYLRGLLRTITDPSARIH